MVRPHTEILFGHKKEGHSDTCYNMGDPEDMVLSEMSRHRRTHTAGCHSQEVPRVTEP
jgi:hypothetical protein